jgi:hypothetical protein
MDTIRLPRADFVRYDVTLITDPTMPFSFEITSGTITQGMLVVDSDPEFGNPTDIRIYNMQVIKSIKSFRGQFK